MKNIEKNINGDSLKKILDRNGFLKNRLNPNAVSVFTDIVDRIFCADAQKNHRKDSVNTKFIEIIQIIKGSHSEMTLSSIVKKIAIVHIFQNKSIEHNSYNQQLGNSIKNQIDLILNELSIVSNKKQQGNFAKIYQFISEWQVLKSIQNNQSVKLNIQKQHQNAALKEIINKTIKPFCLYLLKIKQDHQIYEFFIREKKLNNGVYCFWKLINWSRGLGDIIMELNRIGRYFRQDLAGIWVCMNYIMSMDLSIYYPILKQNIDRQTLIWKQDIIKLGAQASKDILENQQFTSFRRKFQEINLLREQLNYLYSNHYLRNWRKYFIKPVWHKSEIYSKQQNLSLVQNFIYYKQSLKRPLRYLKKRSFVDYNDEEIEKQFQNAFGDDTNRNRSESIIPKEENKQKVRKRKILSQIQGKRYTVNRENYPSQSKFFNINTQSKMSLDL